MDKAAAAPERAVIHKQASDTPPGWAEALDSLATDTGLALLLVAGHQPPSLVAANNNSICRAFQSSPRHAHLCEPFCGKAYERAMQAEAPAPYRCHAGLHCVALPVETGDEAEPRLAVIGGRAFLRSADYRQLAERIRTGELADLLSEDLFRNVIFASRQDLDELAERVGELASELARAARTRMRLVKPAAREGSEGGESGGGEVERPEPQGTSSHPLGEVDFSSGVTLEEACSRAVPALVEASRLESVALMLKQNENFVPYCVTGRFAKNPPRLALRAKELKLMQAAASGETLLVPLVGGRGKAEATTAELFPLLIGQEIKGAVLVAGEHLSAAQRQAVSEFAREIVLPLEILRLREELERRMSAATHLRAFTEDINSVKPEEAYAAILRHSAELLRAERGSLLLFDERANELAVKAAVGPRAEVSRDTRQRLGDGVAGTVLSEGRPLVVSDIRTAGHQPASPERSYKTGSFISYPLIIGGRKVGVLNVTDKAGGGVYDDVDLKMLEMIAPQMALALDRAEWHQKATQFQLLSITDPLTGLVNRRYMEERLSEELERSKRHRFPTSFIMIDIDDFKSYNDRHGHQAGDLALEMTAQCLKSALRSADVASRYGGEEFSILLPQTNLSEAHVIAERIRRRVERTHYPHGKTQPLGAVTVSLGISAFGPNLDTPASIIYAADQALYVAKHRGKNCVEAFSPAMSDTSTGDVERKKK